VYYALRAKIGQGMGKRNQVNRIYGKSAHYWRPEMIPLFLTAVGAAIRWICFATLKGH